MIDRFAVRRSGKGFGVWDAGVNGWRSELDLDEVAATEIADRMNADEAVAGNTPDTIRESRRVRPPRRVLILIGERWWPGSLDMWVRETDGWYGRATLDADGPTNWYPSKALRPGTR